MIKGREGQERREGRIFPEASYSSQVRGGHLAGEVASRMALSAIVNIALDIPDWILKLDEEHARTMEQVEEG